MHKQNLNAHGIQRTKKCICSASLLPLKMPKDRPYFTFPAKISPHVALNVYFSCKLCHYAVWNVSLKYEPPWTTYMHMKLWGQIWNIAYDFVVCRFGKESPGVHTCCRYSVKSHVPVRTVPAGARSHRVLGTNRPLSTPPKRSLNDVKPRICSNWAEFSTQTAVSTESVLTWPHQACVILLQVALYTHNKSYCPDRDVCRF